MEQEKNGIRSKYLKSSNNDDKKEPTEIRNQSNSEISSSLPVEMPVHTNRTSFKSQDLLVPWHARSDKRTSKAREALANCFSGTNEEHLPATGLKSPSTTVNENSTLTAACDACVDVLHKEEVETNPSEFGKTFHRYYHVFQSGELEYLCSLVSSLTVVRSYYDQGNWCVVVERKGKEEESR